MRVNSQTAELSQRLPPDDVLECWGDLGRSHRPARSRAAGAGAQWARCAAGDPRTRPALPRRLRRSPAGAPDLPGRPAVGRAQHRRPGPREPQPLPPARSVRPGWPSTPGASWRTRTRWSPSCSPGAGSVGLDDHMWAGEGPALRAAMPGGRAALGRRACIDDLRMRKAAAEIAALRAARGRRSTPRARPDGGVAAPRPHRGARSAATSPTRSSPKATRASTSSSSARGPNGASPHHDVSDRVIEPRRRRRRRHRRHDARRLLLGLHPDLRRRRPGAGAPPLLRGAARAHRKRPATRSRPGVTRRERRRGRPGRHRRPPATASSSSTAPATASASRATRSRTSSRATQTPLGAGHGVLGRARHLPAGRHGARIEDIVVVTADGVDRLDTDHRDLVVLG